MFFSRINHSSALKKNGNSIFFMATSKKAAVQLGLSTFKSWKD